DEAHRRAFEQLEALWNAGSVQPPAWPAPEEMRADAYDGEMSVSAWREAQSRAGTPRPDSSFAAPGKGRRIPFPGYRRRFAAAAALLLLIGAGLLPQVQVLFAPSSARLETRAGERRSLLLADGSRITAGGLSSVSVEFSADRREIRLLAGEAFFKV